MIHHSEEIWFQLKSIWRQNGFCHWVPKNFFLKSGSRHNARRNRFSKKFSLECCRTKMKLPFEKKSMPWQFENFWSADIFKTPDSTFFFWRHFFFDVSNEKFIHSDLRNLFRNVPRKTTFFRTFSEIAVGKNLCRQWRLCTFNNKYVLFNRFHFIDHNFLRARKENLELAVWNFQHFNVSWTEEHLLLSSLGINPGSYSNAVV